MAQTRVESPEDIYNTLSGDSEFSSFLGSYKFRDSSTLQPALSVVTPNQLIPNLEEVYGLEVIIHDIADISRKDFLTDPSIGLLTYKVYLVLWNGEQGSVLTNAALRMVNLFSGARSILTVPINKTPSVSSQVLVEIPNNALIY